jgi:hypothetical protein
MSTNDFGVHKWSIFVEEDASFTLLALAVVSTVLSSEENTCTWSLEGG